MMSETARSTCSHMSANGESASCRRRALRSCGPSTKRSTSPTVIESGWPRQQIAALGAAARFHEAALLQAGQDQFQKFLRNFLPAGAISAILTGSPGLCEARSKIACSAYSPLTEMFKLKMLTCVQSTRNFAIRITPPNLPRGLENIQCLLVQIFRNRYVPVPAAELLIRFDSRSQSFRTNARKEGRLALRDFARRRATDPLARSGISTHKSARDISLQKSGGRTQAAERDRRHRSADRSYYNRGTVPLHLLRCRGLEMNEVALTRPERRFHALRRSGVDDVNARPIDAIEVRRVFEHDERLHSMVREQRGSLEILPGELARTPPGGEKETIAPVNLGKVDGPWFSPASIRRQLEETADCTTSTAPSRISDVGAPARRKHVIRRIETFVSKEARRRWWK